MTGEYVGKASGGKLLRLRLSVENGMVTAIAIRGDFFAHPEDAFDQAEAGLVGVPVAALGARFKAALEQLGVSLYGLVPEDLDTAASSILAAGETQHA